MLMPVESCPNHSTSSLRPYSLHQSMLRSMSAQVKLSLVVSIFDHQMGMFTTLKPSSATIFNRDFSCGSVQP